MIKEFRFYNIVLWFCFNFAKNILVLETLWRRGALEDAPYIVYGCIMLGCAVYIYVCDATIFKASYKLMQFVHWSLKEEKVLPTTKVGGSNSWERKFLWVSKIAEIANYTLVYLRQFKRCWTGQLSLPWFDTRLWQKYFCGSSSMYHNFSCNLSNFKLRDPVIF